MADNSAPEPAAPRRRKAGGRPFQKGVSGNPGGVPKVVREVKELLANEGVQAAVDYLLRCVKGEEKEIRQTEDGEVVMPLAHRVRVQAATTLLDFGMAKPKQEVGLSQGEGDALEIVIRTVSE